MNTSGRWAGLNKKDKLLFSFATNTVKMCGFVEPAQRKRLSVPVSVAGFVWIDLKSAAEPGQ
jgi:hypothetical protein